MKSNASFIHEESASYTSICHRVVLWVLGFLCFSTTGFSQQLDQPPSVPADPNGLIGPTDSSNLPTPSQTPLAAPVPAPTARELITEDCLIGLDMKKILYHGDFVHNFLMGFGPNLNMELLTKRSEYGCCWIEGVVSGGWILAKNGEMQFTYNPAFIQNNEFQELDTDGAWSLSENILRLKLSHKCTTHQGSMRTEQNSLIELKIEQCQHKTTEDELQKMRAQFIAAGGHLHSWKIGANDWNNLQKNQFDFYCVSYNSQIRQEFRHKGKITISEGYNLGGKSRNLKHNGPPSFVGRMKLNTNSEPGSGVPPSPTVPAIAGPAVAAINELEQDCQRSSLDQQNQETPPSEDPSIIRRQQIILSVNGRTFPVNVVVHNRDEFSTDVGTRTPTIHIGNVFDLRSSGGIIRYHRGVSNEIATIITDANDGEFDGIMTDASGQPLSPLATEEFSDRFSADYLAYQRTLLVPNQTSNPKNPLDRYLAPLEQGDRSLTESLLNPGKPRLTAEPYYADEQNSLNARADVFSEADRLIRDGRLDDAFALFKMKSDIIGRAYYCKLLETYEHYFPEKAQRKQEQ